MPLAFQKRLVVVTSGSFGDSMNTCTPSVSRTGSSA